MATRELASPPNLALLYGRAVVAGRRRGTDLPDDELVVRDTVVDPDHLAAYDRLCGFTVTGRLPATYLHLLAFPLAVRLMTDPSFPLPPVGLVHVANRITQHRPVDVTEPVTVRVALRDLREHEKGTAFDVVAEATAGDELVWSEVSTNLRRGEGAGGGGGPRPAAASSAAPTARWRVAADTGRRYAAVSGDRNPIHLWPLTARAFGFPRPVAHGMWTKARCLAALEGRLPDRFTVAVDFKAPLLLPSTVDFAAEAVVGGDDPRAGARAFAVRSARGGKPHLAGELLPA